jgi:hypothetical protein
MRALRDPPAAVRFNERAIGRVIVSNDEQRSGLRELLLKPLRRL